MTDAHDETRTFASSALSAGLGKSRLTELAVQGRLDPSLLSKITGHYLQRFACTGGTLRLRYCQETVMVRRRSLMLHV